MLDHTNNKTMQPDSLNMSSTAGKFLSEALERDFPANQQSSANNSDNVVLID